MFSLRRKIIRGDHELRSWLGIWHIDYPEVPPCARTTHGHTRPLATRTILKWAGEDIVDLIFVDPVSGNVRRA
ncbi:MAG: hypothetical protein A2Y95_02105 [Deltaproteobacteria bacterium RBG_13_65_10]|nr:MAG: hypothetical protein A2Y95_02105 [Deltaproteobacteria bacterium RBG_13_65_10]